MKIKEWMLAGLLAVGMNGAGKVLAGNLESTAAAWSIPYGREFWRQAQPASRTTEVRAEESAAALAQSGVNIGDVMERVACSFRAGAKGEALAAEGRTYRAVYERNRVVFSPFLPARSNVAERIYEEPLEARLEKRRGAKPDPATLPSPDPDTAARFRTVRVTVGDTVLYDVASAPALAEESALGNTIQRLLNVEAGLVEHWQTRREGMEVAWVLQKPPAGGGPLVIEVEAAGLGLVGATANVAHYGNDGVGRVRISGATAVDAAGKRCELAMRTDSDRIVYELPATFLASAAYPLAVDPIISAEFGMDKPSLCPCDGLSVSSEGRVGWDQLPGRVGR